MFFLEKKKTIVIDAFVSEEYAHAAESAPITKAYFPDWWKAVPPSSFNYDNMNTDLTVRGCVGMIDTFQNGFILPLWSDVAIKLDGKGSWQYQFADNLSSISAHPSIQAPGFFENHIAMKIESPWVLSYKGDLKLSFTQPQLWQNEVPFITPGSINEFIHGLMSINIFTLIRKDIQQEFIIDHHTPMLHILPITDKDVMIKQHIVSKEEVSRMIHTAATNVKFNYDGLQKRKTCPFRKK